MQLLRTHNYPKSTKIIFTALIAVSLIIFVIKMFKLRQGLTYEVPQADGTVQTVPVAFHDIQVPYIQLIPRYVIFYPWVLITSIFAEISILSLIISSVVSISATKYMDKFWGYKEVVKFILIVGLITNLITVLITIICNVMRSDVKGMDKPLGGGISYYFAFLVVLKQWIPEHNIVLFQGLINFRVKHLPFALLNIIIVWSILISRSLYPAVPSISSFIISYNYLRFHQSFASDPILPITTASGSSDQDSLVKGDASDTFQLVEFFPAILKPYLSVVFNQIYELSVLIGIVTPFNDDNIEQSNIRAQKRFEQVNQTQKSVANSVAERRRQVALQVIEDRINKESRAN